VLRFLVLILSFVSCIWKPTLEVGTLVGVVYLVYDTYFQTEATVSSVASDPKNPFLYPFTLANNSHVFSLKNVQMTCRLITIVYPNNMVIEGPKLIYRATANEIPPNGVLNLRCGAVAPGAPPLSAAEIIIEANYDVPIIFGLSKSRAILPTRFTWVASASNPQWVKGEFPK
jgi:hypothetical protein